LIEQEIEIYHTTGAIGAARAAGLHKGDFVSYSKNIMDNDHIMTIKPQKNKTAFVAAYENWKNELNLVLTKE
jgi:xylulokinase